MSLEYWEICCEEILGDDGLSSERLKEVAKDFERAAEMAGEACGHYLIPNPDRAEIDRLEKALERERSAEYCKPCQGSGRLRFMSGPWAVDTGCHHCGGEGKVYRP